MNEHPNRRHLVALFALGGVVIACGLAGCAARQATTMPSASAVAPAPASTLPPPGVDFIFEKSP
jgi:hypothetical protein